MRTGVLPTNVTRETPVYPGSSMFVGSRGESVRQIQRCLNNVSMRYPAIATLTEDGIFGYGTRTSVIAFQRIFGLAQDGVVGPATWNKLMLECSSGGGGGGTTYPGYPLSNGSSGSAVLQIQRCLNTVSNSWPALSISRLTEDGRFGPATERAVIMFQQFFLLNPNGVVDANTWDRIMYECQASGAGASTPSYPGYYMSVGSSGSYVQQMQKYLNIVSNRYPSIPKLSEDGIFGNGTRNAVIAFQRQFGLTPDGIIGSATWNKIIEVANSNSNSGNNGNETNPGTSTGDLSADEQEVFNLINQQRANNGLSPLRVDTELQKVAKIKAQDMVTNNYFSHTSPTYGSPFQMLNTFGVSYRTAGENIAGNSRNSAAVTDWMNSSGHRANILDNTFTYTGIGVVSDPVYGKKYVQMFVGR